MNDLAPEPVSEATALRLCRAVELLCARIGDGVTAAERIADLLDEASGVPPFDPADPPKILPYAPPADERPRRRG